MQAKNWSRVLAWIMLQLSSGALQEEHRQIFRLLYYLKAHGTWSKEVVVGGYTI